MNTNLVPWADKGTAYLHLRGRAPALLVEKLFSVFRESRLRSLVESPPPSPPLPSVRGVMDNKSCMVS